MAKYPIVGYMDFLIDQQPPEIRDKFSGKDELWLLQTQGNFVKSTSVL